jgi:hypothetical protein
MRRLLPVLNCTNYFGADGSRICSEPLTGLTRYDHPEVLFGTGKTYFDGETLRDAITKLAVRR